MVTCRLETCDRLAHRNGPKSNLCEAHYKRLRVHGDVRESVPIQHKPTRRPGPFDAKAYMREFTLQKKYGIGVAEYEAMLIVQGGKCAICQTEIPGTHHDWFCVDHDHKTGTVRSLLCHLCNIGLGAFADDTTKLEAAADYLRGWLQSQ